MLRIERRCRQLSSQAPWTLRRPQNSQPLRRRRSPSVQGPKFIDIDLFFNGKDLPIVNRIGEKVTNYVPIELQNSVENIGNVCDFSSWERCERASILPISKNVANEYLLA